MPERIHSADLLLTALIAADGLVADGPVRAPAGFLFEQGFLWPFFLGLVAGLLAGLFVTATIWIIALRSDRRRLIAAANTDALTGLLNRGAFASCVNGRAMRVVLSNSEIENDPKNEREGVGVVFLDINNFKQINDRYGHVVGDEVLKEIGRRLLAFAGVGEIGVRSNSEPIDETVTHGRSDIGFFGATTFFRMGGDEFLGVIMVPSRERLEQAVRVLKTRLSEPIRIDVGSSAGGETKGKHVSQVTTLSKTTNVSQTTSHTPNGGYTANIHQLQSLVVRADSGVAWGTPDVTLGSLYKSASDDLRDQRLAIRLQATDE